MQQLLLEIALAICGVLGTLVFRTYRQDLKMIKAAHQRLEREHGATREMIEDHVRECRENNKVLVQAVKEISHVREVMDLNTKTLERIAENHSRSLDNLSQRIDRIIDPRT